MGRWTDITRERLPRDWMLPDPDPWVPDSQGFDPRAGTPVATSVRVRRPTWARTARRPLRRNEGIPGPLETPLYLLRIELARARARRRRQALLLSAVAVAVAAAALAVRLLISS